MVQNNFKRYPLEIVRCLPKLGRMAKSTPEATMSVTTLRLEPELMERVRALARKNRRGLSAEIATLIDEALAVREAQRGQDHA